MSAAKKFYPGVVGSSCFIRVYDLVVPGMPYLTRYEMLQQMLKDSPNPNVILADTHNVDDSDAGIRALHEQFVARGFEGTIIRNWDGQYAINKRSQRSSEAQGFHRRRVQDRERDSVW
jgi:hypothetical protein